MGFIYCMESKFSRKSAESHISQHPGLATSLCNHMPTARNHNLNTSSKIAKQHLKQCQYVGNHTSGQTVLKFNCARARPVHGERGNRTTGTRLMGRPHTHTGFVPVMHSPIVMLIENFQTCLLGNLFGYWPW